MTEFHPPEELVVLVVGCVLVLLAMLGAVAYTNMKDAHRAELDESKKIDPEHHPESAANPAPEDNGSTGA